MNAVGTLTWEWKQRNRGTATHGTDAFWERAAYLSTSMRLKPLHVMIKFTDEKQRQAECLTLKPRKIRGVA